MSLHLSKHHIVRNHMSRLICCLSLDYSMNIKPLTEHHLLFLSLKGGCTGLSQSTLVKTQHCWKSHVAAHLLITLTLCILVTPKCIMRYSILSGSTLFA